MMIAEDCFFFHSAGKTFSKVGKKNVKKLMHDNKRKLRKKYSGRIELYRLRDRNIKRMKEYLLAKKEAAADPADIDYKFNNRMLLAKGMYPHSPVKKILYSIRLDRLYSEYLRV